MRKGFEEVICTVHIFLNILHVGNMLHVLAQGIEWMGVSI